MDDAVRCLDTRVRPLVAVENDVVTRVTSTTWLFPATRRTTATGRSPGLRITAVARRLPSGCQAVAFELPVAFDVRANRLQLREQPELETPFPFNPRAGNLTHLGQ